MSRTLIGGHGNLAPGWKGGEKEGGRDTSSFEKRKLLCQKNGLPFRINWLYSIREKGAGEGTGGVVSP